MEHGGFAPIIDLFGIIDNAVKGDELKTRIFEGLQPSDKDPIDYIMLIICWKIFKSGKST